MPFSKTRRAAIAAASALTLGLAACGGGSEESTVTALDAGSEPADERAEALAVSTASLGNLTCRNQQLGAIRADNIIVPAGSTCRLSGTHLDGSLEVGQGAQLDARNVVATGNLVADGAAAVMLSGTSRVAGSVQIKQGGTASVLGAQIGGDLQIDTMSGAVLASANQVGGSLQATGNLGGATVIDNRMVGNLQCKENLPAPVARNNVAASIEDQCVEPAGEPPVAGGVTPAPVGLAGNVTCTNLAIGAVALDTVIVPANASCTLTGTRLIGSIVVGQNARIDAQGVRVNGSLQADGAASVVLSGSSVILGSVQIKQGSGASISGAVITGDLQIDAMRAPVNATSNRVGGSMQVMENRGGVSLTRNSITGNLQCKGNLPVPIGSANTASLKEDQCLRL